MDKYQPDYVFTPLALKSAVTSCRDGVRDEEGSPFDPSPRKPESHENIHVCFDMKSSHAMPCLFE
jgi:hypothetical protein